MVCSGTPDFTASSPTPKPRRSLDRDPVTASVLASTPELICLLHSCRLRRQRTGARGAAASPKWPVFFGLLLRRCWRHGYGLRSTLFPRTPEAKAARGHQGGHRGGRQGGLPGPARDARARTTKRPSRSGAHRAALANFLELYTSR